MGEVKRCKRCIMDNLSDKTIKFDKRGYCNYCTTALKEKNLIYFHDVEGNLRLKAVVTSKFINIIRYGEKQKLPYNYIDILL